MKKYFLIGFFLCSLAACQSEMDKYYEVPDWLKGNAFEVMEDKGTFSIFMKAVERSSYADLVKGKGIVTVMAPTDEAFAAYLSKHNYNSVDDIPEVELNKLVGYHLVYYSYSKNDFLFYNPNGVDSEQQSPGAYFKFRTKSRDAISTAVDRANNNAVRKIMHKERFIPIISDFSLSSSSHKEDYETMFPGSVYTGGIGSFNVANASVIGDEMVTDNGYLYTVNQVIEPLETIYGEMNKENSDYTLFAGMYDRFVNYKYDEDATRDYGNGDSLFVHSHYMLPPIACEWTNFTSTTKPDYAQMDDLTSISFAVLAPDNASINQFFQKYWASSYASLDEVNFVPLYQFMNAHAIRYGGHMVGVYTLGRELLYSDIWDDNQLTMPNDVKVCSNGILGGMKGNVITPEVFETPIAPALCDKNYNIFALLCQKGSLYDIFNKSLDKKFNVFFPTDEMFLNSEYNGDYIQYLKGNPYIITDEQVQVANSTDGTMSNATTSQSKAIAGAHIADGIMAQKSETEVIYSTYNDYEYLYRKGNKVYSSATWNSERFGNEVSVPQIELIKSYDMGNAYALKGDKSATSLIADQGNFKDRVKQIKGVNDYSGFSIYLGMASVDDDEPAFNFLQGNRFIVFVSTQAAVLADLMSTNPKFNQRAPQAERDMFVKSLFVDMSASGLIDYPFATTGKDTEKVLTTFGSKTVAGKKVSTTITLINKADGSMKLRDSKGNEVNITSFFPYIYADGAAYVIDGVLDLLN
ncbi:fasciclin domain-containing protein [Bacteroides sp.]|uniref:fasciclin domain-containing protein n=1 Tax=Bacteroides sp. TaxID=29523 RepID=UPI0025BDEAB5|nr:fasciclin domain-containing protein [Bacteroides sp.]